MIAYYGLTQEETKNEEIVYKQNNKYSIKGINLSLEGLKKFIIDNKMHNIIKYYTEVDLNNFEIDESIIKDEVYNMIAVKIPFKFKINKVYKINWRNL